MALAMKTIEKYENISLNMNAKQLQLLVPKKTFFYDAWINNQEIERATQKVRERKGETEKGKCKEVKGSQRNESCCVNSENESGICS